MSAQIIDGKAIAQEIRENIKKEVQELKEKYNIVPGLVTILVGEDPASISYVKGKQKTAQELCFYSVEERLPENISEEELLKLIEKYNIVPGLVTILVGEDPASISYVKGKQKTAQELGFYSVEERLPENISEEELLKLIEKYNKDPKIHGILVQLPLPKHIDERKVIYTIDPKKDVDGFHPVNIGKMIRGEPCFLPCTPYGILVILEKIGCQVEGAEVVVIGRSNIVGKPIANLLMQKRKLVGNATVTVCHTGTKDLTFHTKRADILIVAIGKPKFITADMVKEGAVVIDVGVNRIGTTPEGKAILCGDVDFESVKEKAGAITPVPGGVGPMTITMLMKNTLESAKMWNGLPNEIEK